MELILINKTNKVILITIRVIIYFTDYISSGGPCFANVLNTDCLCMYQHCRTIIYMKDRFFCLHYNRT